MAVYIIIVRIIHMLRYTIIYYDVYTIALTNLETFPNVITVCYLTIIHSLDIFTIHHILSFQHVLLFGRQEYVNHGRM